jgi:soluble lytic murein transglycosylase
MTLARQIGAAVVLAVVAWPAILTAQLPLASRLDTTSWWHRAAALRPAIESRTASPAEVRQFAEAELGLGRPDRAMRLLRTANPGDSLGSAGRLLLGTAALAAGEYALAGPALHEAATGLTGRTRGIVLARAAEAYARAGADSVAVGLYAEAAVLLPPIAGWLAVREAAVTSDPAKALRLLRRAPPEAAFDAARVRAATLLASGDSARALTSLLQSADWALALRVALALDDSASARRAAYPAALEADTEVVRQAVRAIEAGLAPTTQREWFVAAAGLNRLGRTRDAIALLRRAAALGDTSAALLRRVGDLLSSIGARREATEAYARAMDRDDDEAPRAEYRRARLLTRLNPATDGYAALAAFAVRHPGHDDAPLALYLVADWHRDRGHAATADSVLAEVSARWPTATYASRARLALAQSALAAGDTTTALAWYRSEVEAEAPQADAARHFLADLAESLGDSATAQAIWRELATEDPVGYYGTVAHAALGSHGPFFPQAGPLPRSAAAQRTLERVDLLQAAWLTAEADTVVQRQLRRREFPDDELLVLAAGLIERGWTAEGVRLGWKAAATRTLTDPHVIRLVFPYPLRAMVEREAREHGIDPYLLAAVIRQESAFRPTVISHAGAHGLMQLMPATAKEVARRAGIAWDPRYLESAEANLHLGATHLAALLRQYDGRVVPALAAYNAGGRPVSRWLRYPEASDPVRFVERIPYVETRGYLRAVLRNRELYRGLYPPTPAPAAAGGP